MNANLSGELDFDYIPKKKTGENTSNWHLTILGFFWNPGYRLKIQVLKDQESKAPEFRNTSAEVFKML